MKINILTIPHKEQRYDTCGDYWEDASHALHIRISHLPDPRYEQLILIHELVEYFLLKIAKIPISKVDLFDIKFEKNRKEGDLSEPGDDPKAPYYHQHQIATIVERLCAHFFKVDWSAYENAVLELEYEKD